MDLVVMSGEFVRQRKSPDPVVTAGSELQEFTLQTSFYAMRQRATTVLSLCRFGRGSDSTQNLEGNGDQKYEGVHHRPGREDLQGGPENRQ